MVTRELQLTFPKGKKNSVLDSNFFVKNNKVFILKEYDSIKYATPIENDSEYFFESIKACEKLKYSSADKAIFTPTSEDWKQIRSDAFVIILPLTMKCNSGCKICFMKDGIPFEEMNIKDVQSILSKIGKNKRVLLFGGEPTMKKDIFKIIKLVKESGNIPEIYTNGLKLANQNFVKRLKKSGIERILLSFDGFREDIYEKLRGNKEYLYTKFKALKNLEKYNIEVYLSMTLFAGLNEDELPKLFKFAIKNTHFIRGLNIIGATPWYGRFDINMEKYLTPSDIIEILDNVTSGIISKKYFIEFSKLRTHINNILNKIGKSFQPGNSTIILNIYNNQLEHFIPLKDLSEINDLFQERKITSTLKYLIKHRNYCFYLLKLLSRNLYIGKNLLSVSVRNASTPFTYMPIDCGFIGIGKIDKNTVFNYCSG